MKDGWIKLHRRITEWEWYQEPKVFKVFLHILLKANFEDKRWQGIEVKRGQLITSIDSLFFQLNKNPKNPDISIRSIRTALTKLKTTNELTINSTTKYTLITINKYSEYQETTNDLTNERQTNDKQTTTTKEIKKERIEEEEEVGQVLKKANRLNLTRSQLLAVHREFPSITLEELKDQLVKCNNYMTISSATYSNPGLFFKGWIKKFSNEKKRKIDEARSNEEVLNGLPRISEEQRKKNIEKISEIKNLYKLKGV